MIFTAVSAKRANFSLLSETSFCERQTVTTEYIYLSHGASAFSDEYMIWHIPTNKFTIHPRAIN